MSTPSEADALRARAEQWTRFAAWESRAETGRARSLSSDLAWLADAMDLAARLAPRDPSPERIREKAARLARIRRALSALDRRAS